MTRYRQTFYLLAYWTLPNPREHISKVWRQDHCGDEALALVVSPMHTSQLTSPSSPLFRSPHRTERSQQRNRNKLSTVGAQSAATMTTASQKETERTRKDRVTKAPLCVQPLVSHRNNIVNKSVIVCAASCITQKQHRQQKRHCVCGLLCHRETTSSKNPIFWSDTALGKTRCLVVFS